MTNILCISHTDPPFEEATDNDRWYQYIKGKQYDKFWILHQNAGIPDGVKKLLEGMLCYNVCERLSTDQIMKDPWYNGITLNPQELKIAIQRRLM